MLMMPQQAYALRPMAAKQANNPGPRADNPGPGIKNPGPEETFQEFIDALDTVHIPGLDIAAIKDIIINRRDIRRRLMEITKRLKKQPAGKKLLSQLKPALDALGSLWNGIKSTSKSDKTSSLMIFIRGLESEFEFEGEFAKDDVLKIMKAIASLTGDYAKSKAPPEHEFPEELEEELKTDIFRLNFWAKERVLDVEVVTEVIENRTEAFLNYTDETQKLQLAIRDMDYAKENLFPVVELRFLKAGNEEYIRLTRLNEKQIKLELKGENIWNLISCLLSL